MLRKRRQLEITLIFCFQNQFKQMVYKAISQIVFEYEEIELVTTDYLSSFY
jgi:hypothetical protein